MMGDLIIKSMQETKPGEIEMEYNINNIFYSYNETLYEELKVNVAIKEVL